jgi:hypothetical protein
MRRTRKPREYTDAEVESYVGRDVMVPGKIFKMRDPYYAVITGRDPVKRNSVICQFKEDDSEYWFPLGECNPAQQTLVHRFHHSNLCFVTPTATAAVNIERVIA